MILGIRLFVGDAVVFWMLLRIISSTLTRPKVQFVFGLCCVKSCKGKNDLLACAILSERDPDADADADADAGEMP